MYENELLLLLTTGQSLIIFIICLQSERIEKYQFELCPKYGREYDFDDTLGLVVFCRKLRWICRNHSIDVARQVEIGSFFRAT